MDDKIHNWYEIFSSGGATLYKNPSDQTVCIPMFEESKDNVPELDPNT